MDVNFYYKYIMRIILFTLLLVGLASCGFNKTETTTEPTQNTGSTQTESGVKETHTSVSDGAYVTLNYTLRDGAANGKVLETTVYDIATQNGMTGKTQDQYTPFSVMIGSNQVIPGFENGLKGMKTGEKKVIEVPPELGYGTGPVMSTIPKYQIAPVFSITQDKKVFADKISETVNRTELPEDMKSAKVGQVFTGANNATAKVTSVNETSITLEIQNTNSPFYGKKLAVGEFAENATKDATFKITAMEWTGVTVEVTNKNSPFYNKKFAVGESIQTPNGKIEIKSIEKDTVTVAQYHPMVGKTLFFDVEIVSIK